MKSFSQNLQKYINDNTKKFTLEQLFDFQLKLHKHVSK